jgi:hypothetical protein
MSNVFQDDPLLMYASISIGATLLVAVAYIMVVKESNRKLRQQETFSDKRTRQTGGYNGRQGDFTDGATMMGATSMGATAMANPLTSLSALMQQQLSMQQLGGGQTQMGMMSQISGGYGGTQMGAPGYSTMSYSSDQTQQMNGYGQQSQQQLTNPYAQSPTSYSQTQMGSAIYGGGQTQMTQPQYSQQFGTMNNNAQQFGTINAQQFGTMNNGQSVYGTINNNAPYGNQWQ